MKQPSCKSKSMAPQEQTDIKMISLMWDSHQVPFFNQLLFRNHETTVTVSLWITCKSGVACLFTNILRLLSVGLFKNSLKTFFINSLRNSTSKLASKKSKEKWRIWFLNKPRCFVDEEWNTKTWYYELIMFLQWQFHSSNRFIPNFSVYTISDKHL